MALSGLTMVPTHYSDEPTNTSFPSFKTSTVKLTTGWPTRCCYSKPVLHDIYKHVWKLSTQTDRTGILHSTAVDDDDDVSLANVITSKRPAVETAVWHDRPMTSSSWRHNLAPISERLIRSRRRLDAFSASPGSTLSRTASPTRTMPNTFGALKTERPFKIYA